MDSMLAQGTALRTSESGVLTIAINYGNAVLANCDAEGAPSGVSVDLARRIAKELSLECRLVTFNAAMDATGAVGSGACDLGFFAIDPARAEQVAFTRPYLAIQGNYLVRDNSQFFSQEDVDQPGVQISVAKGSAYDLYLSRYLTHATLIRHSHSSRAVVDTFIQYELDVAAGVRLQLQTDADRIGGLRMIDPSFMLIRQAIGISKALEAQLIKPLDQCIARMIADKFIAGALARHGVEGADLLEDTTQ